MSKAYQYMSISRITTCLQLRNNSINIKTKENTTDCPTHNLKYILNHDNKSLKLIKTQYSPIKMAGNPASWLSLEHKQYQIFRCLQMFNP